VTRLKRASCDDDRAEPVAPLQGKQVVPLTGRPRGRTLALTALALLVALVAGACDATGSPGPSSLGSDTPATTEAPLTTQPSDPAMAAAVGPWRRVPFKADPGFGALYVAACRAASPDIGQIPATVVDVRGRGWITVLFASSQKAFLCRTTVGDPAHPLAIESIDVPAGTLAGGGVDLANYEELGKGSETTSFAVGRVGPTPSAVIAGFDDQTFVFGTMGGGWYVMWWPTGVTCDGISSVNNSHIVLDSTHAPCEANARPSSSPTP
jgi:hypothetical protein